MRLRSNLGGAKHVLVRAMERALRDFSLGTEERLKVACVVARNGSSDIPEDRFPFLTRWACEEICRAYSKKNRQGS